MEETDTMRLATFGGGCFWCLEAIFRELNGVTRVLSGYSGGDSENPSYEEVCTGETGHAEVIQVSFDPEKVSYEELLEVFWKIHDPTTRNRQGNDVGSQYRSVIFYHSEDQKKLAEYSKNRLEAEGIWNRPIVTEIKAFTAFWPAETYHRDYYEKNPSNGYCSVVIRPKIEKFKELFKDRLRDS